jgi:hypothetical protein
MAWIAGATYLNPLAGTVLVDTGPLRAGYYKFQIVASANTGLEVLLQYRDATNTLTLKQKTLPITLSQSYVTLGVVQRYAPNERLRVVARADVTTGEVEVHILAEIPWIPGYQFWTPS